MSSDTTMDPGFASQLNGTCSSDPNTFAFLDPSTVGSEQVLVRYEVAQHGRLLRVQPGCLLR